MTPIKALQRYRDEMDRQNARLVVVTLTSAVSSLVDGVCCDPRILHLAGFDASTPAVIRSFALGQLDSLAAA
jgi:hypothetical protein